MTSSSAGGLGRHLRAIAIPVGVAVLTAGGLATPSRAASETHELERVAPGQAASLELTPPSLLAQEAALAYAIGDRLKITFFEQLQSELRGGQAVAKVMSTLVERTELTGEYLIHQDGSVFLPLLGPVSVLGHTPRQFEEALADAFSRHWNGQVKISLQLIDREPIYVTGSVAKPGTYKHVPGMTVLHALTLAGGVEGAGTDHWKLLDGARERERMRKSAERLKRLLARTEVLKSERDGRAPSAPIQLVDLIGQPAAQSLVATEERLRALERAKRKDQDAALDAMLAALRNELAIQREKMLQIETGMKEKAERVQEMVALRTRGATTDVNFHMARSELNEARQRWQEVRAGIAQTERKIGEVQHDKTRLGMDTQIEREREIKDALQAITEEEVTRATIGNLLLSNPAYATVQGPKSGKDPSYTILRRTPSGPQRLSAGEVSALEPGDILRVGPAHPELAATPGPLQN